MQAYAMVPGRRLLSVQRFLPPQKYLPSAQLVGAVDRLACLTGSNPMPDHKKKMNYRYESKKFEVAGLTPIAFDLVKAPRAKECPVQLEAVVENIRPFGENDPGRPIPTRARMFG
jgi:hypothetical protein